MAYRPHWTAEAISEAPPVSSTSYATVLELTHPASGQEVGEYYAVIWTAGVQINSTSNDYRLRLVQDGSVVTRINNEAKETGSPVDYDSQGLLHIYTPASTPADIVFEIQLACENGSDTARAKDCRLSIIKLSAADQFDTELTRTTDSSGDWISTNCSVTFTPATSGDYTVIGAALLDAASGGQTEMRIAEGANLSLEAAVLDCKDASNRTAAMVIWPRTALSGSKTFTLQYVADDAPIAAGISEMRLLILRNDEFDAVYSTVQASKNSGTQTSYQTTVSQTFTPAATPHLTLASWRVLGSSASISSYSQFVDRGTVVNESVREPNASGDSWPSVSHRVASYAASSGTQAIQRKSETGSTTTEIGEGAAIVTFDLGADDTVSYPIAGSISGAGSASGVTGAARPAAGGISGAASASGATGAIRPAGGGVAGLGTLTADLGRVAAMAGSGAGAGGATAAIGRSAAIEGVVAGGSDAEGAIDVASGMAGDVTGSATALAVLGRTAGLAGAVSGAAAVAANDNRTAPMAGVLSAYAHAVGDIEGDGGGPSDEDGGWFQIARRRGR